jgi:hypothetical protein
LSFAVGIFIFTFAEKITMNNEKVQVHVIERVSVLTTEEQLRLEHAVPNTRTINDKPLSNNITLSAADVNAQPTLISGTNIKTINGQSVLGSGNIAAGGIGDWVEAILTCNFGSCIVSDNLCFRIIPGAIQLKGYIRIDGDENYDYQFGFTINNAPTNIPEGNIVLHNIENESEETHVSIRYGPSSSGIYIRSGSDNPNHKGGEFVLYFSSLQIPLL